MPKHIWVPNLFLWIILTILLGTYQLISLKFVLNKSWDIWTSWKSFRVSSRLLSISYFFYQSIYWPRYSLWLTIILTEISLWTKMKLTKISLWLEMILTEMVNNRIKTVSYLLLLKKPLSASPETPSLWVIMILTNKVNSRIRRKTRK